MTKWISRIGAALMGWGISGLLFNHAFPNAPADPYAVTCIEGGAILFFASCVLVVLDAATKDKPE